MTPLLLAILLLFILNQATELMLTFVNLRYLKRHGAFVPKVFEGELDSKTLKKMRDYTLELGRLGIFESIFDILITALFFFGGLLNWYNNFIFGFNLHFILSGVVFFLGLTYVSSIIKIPFNLYHTFHIEEKYDFNKQSPGMWSIDLIKELAITTILYGALLAGAFWLINTFPESWWIITWLFFFLFSLFILYISPYVIEPLFNTFTPIKDQELETRIKELMDKAGLSISKVFTMDASKRSGHSNAYFSGIGHVKRIVLFDTLLQSNSHDEICGILAHEAGHWKKKHIFKRLAAIETLALAGMYLAFLLVQNDFLPSVFNLDRPTLYAKLLVVGFLFSLVSLPFKPVGSWFSRKHEWEADEFAVSLTGSSEPLAHALIKIGRENLANLHPHPVFATFYYSHPPLVQRIEKLLSEGKS